MEANGCGGSNLLVQGKDGKVRSRRLSPVCGASDDGPLTEPIAAVQLRPQERVLMPPKATLPRFAGQRVQDKPTD